MRNSPLNWLVIVSAMATATLSADSATAAGTPQSVMHSCVSDAGSRTGADRKAFMVECLTSRRPTLDQSGSPPKEDPCNGSSASDSMRCSAPSWDKSERELNAAYHELRKKLKAPGLQHLVPRLVEAQRAWLKFRETHCAFSATLQVEGNSWTSFYESSCKAEEADQRTQYLRKSVP